MEIGDYCRDPDPVFCYKAELRILNVHIAFKILVQWSVEHTQALFVLLLSAYNK